MLFLNLSTAIRRMVTVMIKRLISSIVLMLLFLFITLFSINSVMANEKPEITSDSLAVFFDAFFDLTIEENKVPGAAIVVVQNDNLLFSGGYGYADLERMIKVSPSETIFFVESVSKSFTATAVMQLAGEGLIDLEADVNNYLSAFQLADSFEQSVTVADLLVHTGGFDDTDIGAYAKDEEGVTPLDKYLKHNMPARVRPPGEVVSYSNHGYALAGLVVEEVSGIPFTRHMDQHILGPLEMYSSSFVLSGEMEKKMAPPYIDRGGEFQGGSFLYHNYSPAGSLKATAVDMANFIILHLLEGQFKGKQLLSADAAELMHRQQFTNHPDLPGWTYGFYEKYINGHRTIMHGGANRLGHSGKLFLVPDEQLGFFYAANTFNPQLRDQLVAEFMNYFFPAEEEFAVPEGLVLDQNEKSRVAGQYYSTRQSINSVEKIMMLLGQLRVEVNNDSLQVIYPYNSMFAGESWVKIKPLLFQNATDGSLMAFREDQGGSITHMFIGTEAYERLPGYLSPAIQMALFVGMLVVFISIFFRRPLKVYGDVKDSLMAARFLAALNLIFLTGVVLIFLNYQVELAYGMPLPARLLFLIPLGSAVLTAAVLSFCVHVWLNKHNSLAYRLHYTVFIIAATGFIAFLNYWNLIGIY